TSALAASLWTNFSYSPAHCLPHAPLTSPNQPYFNCSTEFYQDFASGTRLNYTSPVSTSNYLTESRDFLEVGSLCVC
ncbi:hypothetical protein FKM82_028230, partial [Ascaphus truei]